uniref:EF-hand domain-containing protein n=1 Tax=Clastoptera arizonana TaxID=38151 RepID=A0A1B6E669_9HEMI
MTQSSSPTRVENEIKSNTSFRNRRKVNESEMLQSKQNSAENTALNKIGMSYGFKRRKPFLKFMKTKDISYYFEREVYIKCYLKEVLIFIGFLITVIMLAESENTTIDNYYAKVVTNLYIKTQFTVSNKQYRNYFLKISVLDDIWPYIDTVLLRNFYWKYWYHGNVSELLADDYQKVMYENKLIGVPRMKQVRVKNDSCEILKEFKSKFSKCYAIFSTETEDTTAFGPANTSAQEELGSHGISGELSRYGGGGFYMDFNLTEDTSNYTLSVLKKNVWIDRATRFITIDFTLYNANINCFCFAKLMFELMATGAVVPSYEFVTLRFKQSTTTWQYILIIFTTIFIAYLFYYIFEEFYEMMYFRWFYFTMFWNWIDILIICLCLGYIALFAYLHIYERNHFDNLLKADENHPVFDDVLVAKKWYKNMISLVLMLSWFKFAKYLGLSHGMHIMLTTVRKAVPHIFYFALMYFMVVSAFAQLGNLIFGTTVQDFRSFLKSFMSLLRIMVADFDFSAIEQAHSFLGPLYFFLYIFFVFILLTSMFLAIMVDTYSQTRQEINARGVQFQVVDLFGRWFTSFLKLIGLKKLTNLRQMRAEEAVARARLQDIRNLFYKCGFLEAEIEYIFNKFDISEDKIIRPEELNQLLTQLKDLMKEKPEEKAAVSPDNRYEELEELDNIQNQIENMEQEVQGLHEKLDTTLQKINKILERMQK